MTPDPQHLHDEQFFRAAFLYRTPATASSQCPPCPATPSPRRQSLHRSPASADGRHTGTYLQRHNSTPSRRRPTTESQVFPLTPHGQVLRARLERVLISGKVVDENKRRRSREDSISHNWPWYDYSGLASTPPKSASSSDHGHPTHSRSRSRTDPHATTSMSHHPIAIISPSLKHTSTHLPRQSNSCSWTPSLTADTSPVLSEPLDHDVDAVESRSLLTPPPTPPLYGSLSPTVTSAVAAAGESVTVTPGSISISGSYSASSPSYRRQEVEKSVERMDLTLHHRPFNVRKASERCRTIEGYVSFAQIEGLGLPPNGVDDDDDDVNDRQGSEEGEEKRGRMLKIGTWARKWFAGVQTPPFQF